MLARAGVGGRWEGGRTGTSAGVGVEGVWSFAFVVAVAGGRCGLDAHDQGGVFGWDGAGGDEVSEFVDVEGCWLWGIIGRGVKGQRGRSACDCCGLWS